MTGLDRCAMLRADGWRKGLLLLRRVSGLYDGVSVPEGLIEAFEIFVPSTVPLVATKA